MCRAAVRRSGCAVAIVAADACGRDTRDGSTSGRAAGRVHSQLHSDGAHAGARALVLRA